MGNPNESHFWKLKSGCHPFYLKILERCVFTWFYQQLVSSGFTSCIFLLVILRYHKQRSQTQQTILYRFKFCYILVGFSKNKNTQNSQRTTNSNLVALTMKFHACRLAQKASDACGMSYVAVGFCLKISVFPCVSFMKQRQGNLLHLGRSEHSLQHLLGVKAMICEPNLIGSNKGPRV